MAKSPAARLQWLLASVFFVLGGWCVVAPMSVIDLCFRPEFHTADPLPLLLVGAFGAQAMIAGLFAATARFTRTTFAAYGLALLPFFVFDGWFYFVRPMLSLVGMLDAVGNVVMLIVCWLGWRVAPKAS